MKSENAKETHHPISDWARLELEAFFAPFNDALAALLKIKVGSLPNSLSAVRSCCGKISFQGIQWQEAPRIQEGPDLFFKQMHGAE